MSRTAMDDKGRIAIVCMAEGLDRDLLTVRLRDRGSRYLQESHPDVLYGSHFFFFLFLFQQICSSNAIYPAWRCTLHGHLCLDLQALEEESLKSRLMLLPQESIL